MTTETKRRVARTVRFHAVREGDELFHAGKWWLVKGHGIEPGAMFKGIDPKTNEERIETVRNFNPEITCAVYVTRGRMGSVIEGYRNSVVRIIRVR